MRRAVTTALLTAALCTPAFGPAWAKDRDTARPAPAAFQDVMNCKAIADAAVRLACYDQKVAAMGAAVGSNQLVVADRETMREARRGLFGLSLPKLRLFGGDDDTETVKEIEGTIAAVRSAKDGMPIFVLADDTRWKQTDGRNVFAKTGAKIMIRRTALGGYMATVGGLGGIRVMRLAN